jgi:putative nucleotidyltransferase with HDIG domain
MKLNTKIFQSKIARRIFLMFVSCALLPVFCLSIVAYGNVTEQLHEQSNKRLQRVVKWHGLSIYERLLFLETELQLFASSWRKTSETSMPALFDEFNKRFKSRFNAVALFGNMNAHKPIFNSINRPEKLNAEKINRLKAGKSTISITYHSGSSPHIIMVIPVDPKDLNAGYLMGEINPDYLWGIEQGNALPPNTDFCILDASKNVLFSSMAYPDSFYRQAYSDLKHSSSGQFEFAFEDQQYIVSYWTIFMKPRFLVPGWTVVLSQTKADVLAPMSHFKTIFPLVVLMTLWVVLLFSIYSIRKSLVPLESLRKGTRRIAMRNFDHRVHIKSGDEFEELAMDFNEMADQLNRQFKTLNTMSEIDRAILSSLDTKIIVKNVIHRIYDWFVCDSVAVSLMDSGRKNAGRMYFSFFSQREKVFEEAFEFGLSDLDALYAHPEYLISDADKNHFSFLSLLAGQGSESFLILPVLLKEKLKAVIAIGRPRTEVISVEDITRVRRTADQVAVALSNATLIEELDQLNWGTLKALARTVDAKSPWTAGHSTRVTEIALKIGSVMGMPLNKLDDLHRAALLHDIGKVGVPAAILDKPGALDDAEYALIKKHPSIGARILEPIALYKEILPVVLQHHERYDGRGYPGGLSGDEIDIGARILAVADTFDAVKSDRPYRKGWDVDSAIDLITKESGRQFDPDVVKAFLEIMKPVKTNAASRTKYRIA